MISAGVRRFTYNLFTGLHLSTMEIFSTPSRRMASIFCHLLLPLSSSNLGNTAVNTTRVLRMSEEYCKRGLWTPTAISRKLSLLFFSCLVAWPALAWTWMETDPQIPSVFHIGPVSLLGGDTESHSGCAHMFHQANHFCRCFWINIYDSVFFFFFRCMLSSKSKICSIIPCIYTSKCHCWCVTAKKKKKKMLACTHTVSKGFAWPQMLTTSLDLKAGEGKEKLPNSLGKGPRMGETPSADDQGAMDAEWATFDTILYPTMLEWYQRPLNRMKTLSSRQVVAFFSLATWFHSILQVANVKGNV